MRVVLFLAMLFFLVNETFGQQARLSGIAAIENQKIEIVIEYDKPVKFGAKSYYLYLNDVEIRNPKIENLNGKSTFSFKVTKTKFDALPNNAAALLSRGKLNQVEQQSLSTRKKAIEIPGVIKLSNAFNKSDLKQ